MTFGVSPDLALRLWCAVDQLGEPAHADWIARLLDLRVATVRRALAWMEARGYLRSYDPPGAVQRQYLAWVRP